MNANDFLRASQKSPLRNIYGHSSRSLFAPVRQSSNNSTVTAPLSPTPPLPHTTTYGVDRSAVAQQHQQHYDQSSLLAQHARALHDVEARLHAVSERNERLLGHISAQQAQLEQLEKQIMRKEARTQRAAFKHALEHEQAEDAWPQRLTRTTAPAVGGSAPQRNYRAPPDSEPTGDRTALLVLVGAIALFLLVILMVLAMQWSQQQRQQQQQQQPKLYSADGQFSGTATQQQVERAVIDVLSRSLLSQTDATQPTNALLRSLAAATPQSQLKRNNLADSRASGPLLYGP